MNRYSVNLFANPTLYHYSRHLLLGGLPFKKWIKLYGLDQPNLRIADIGCGPADILRYLRRDRFPGFYLGIDVDESYLKSAQILARSSDIKSDFLAFDLTQLALSHTSRQSLVDVLYSREISRVLLLGVLHHIDDASVFATMDVLRSVPSIASVVTQDVVRCEGARINNWLASRDRGRFVRTEEQYISILRQSGWDKIKIDWSQPGVPFVKYIHYTLTR